MGNRLVCVVAVVILMLSGCSLFNPPTPEEEPQPVKIFDIDGSDTYGVDIKETPDGGFIVAARCVDNYSYALILKLDAYGNISWHKKLGPKIYSVAVECSNDGGYVFVGRDITDTTYKNYMIKIDAYGNTLEMKYIYDEFDEIKGLIKLSDGYIVYGAGGSRGMIEKVDFDGNYIWATTLPENLYSWVNDVKIMSDGSYLATGRVRTLTNYPDYMFFSKVTAGGSVLWIKYYNPVEVPTSGYSGVEIDSGAGAGYITTAMIYEPGANYGRFAMFKFDSSGNFVSEKRLGGGDASGSGRHILKTGGNFVVCGYYAEPGDDEQNIYVSKINDNLEKLWSVKMKGDVPRHIGRTMCNQAYRMCVTSDGGIAVTGGVGIAGFGQPVIFVARLRANGLRMW